MAHVATVTASLSSSSASSAYATPDSDDTITFAQRSHLQGARAGLWRASDVVATDSYFPIRRSSAGSVGTIMSYGTYPSAPMSPVSYATSTASYHSAQTGSGGFWSTCARVLRCVCCLHDPS